ncbi:MAG: CrcB family protein [Brachybacterium sp.]|nr:CrcB family protein [Brachybacterium sp.]
MMQVLAILVVALGGAIGASLRWGLAQLLLRYDSDRSSTAVPWATLAANLIACFVLGIVVPLLASAPSGPGLLAYLALGTGICGALSTFSTFTLELVTLYRAGAPVVALGYLLVTIGGAMGALWVGLVIAT